MKHFQDFVTSPGYIAFQGKLKEKIAAGPPVLKIFDPANDDLNDDVSAVFQPDHSVLEYLAIKPRDVSSVQGGLLEKVRAGLPRFGTAKVVVGSSVNLEAQEIGLLSLYASDAVSCSRFRYHCFPSSGV